MTPFITILGAHCKNGAKFPGCEPFGILEIFVYRVVKGGGSKGRGFPNLP